MACTNTLEVPSTAPNAGSALRPLLRDALVYAGVVLLTPLWLAARLEQRFGLGKHFFTGGSELLSLMPGLPGVFLRRSFYRMTLDACATDCHIGFGTILAHPQAHIGRRVYVGSRCTLGRVTLGDDAMIGSNVDVLSGRHQHNFSRGDMPMNAQGGQFRQLSIGRNSWVGNSAVVMADVGNDCVIGAGSVVVKSITGGSIAVGNPAALIKSRAA
jgi:acetyltransferase-like isoleucine patch superfamily enzyme